MSFSVSPEAAAAAAAAASLALMVHIDTAEITRHRFQMMHIIFRVSCQLNYRACIKLDVDARRYRPNKR